MYLTKATWPEIDARIKDKKTAIAIAIGSHEQHGPTGLIGTDAMCPQIILDEAHNHSDILIGPNFGVGQAQHHMAFAGSMTLRPSTMIATIVDWTNSLAHHGFTHIYWLNGHGGNCATINAAFSETYHQYSMRGENAPFKHLLMNWWELPNITKLCLDLFPIGHGSHATASEVALTYWRFQDREILNQLKLEPKIAPNGAIRDALDYKRQFPDGRIGSDPTTATIELGGKIVDACAKSFLQSFEEFSKA
jgi:creatinine amidohydrolase